MSPQPPNVDCERREDRGLETSSHQLCGVRTVVLGIFLFALSLTVYCRTLAPTVGDFGDSAKFQLVAHILGIPHATGYPLYVTLAKLFTLIPLRDVAFRVNLLSAASGACAVALLGAVILQLTNDFVAASSAALLFAWSATFWSQAVIAEVYTLNAALLALVLLLVSLWRARRTSQLYFASIALYSLSLGNHASMILLVPALLWFVATTDSKMLFRPRNIVLAAGIIALGASQYLLLFMRARQHPPFCETCPDTFPKLLWYLTGASFRSSFLAVSSREILERTEMYCRQLAAEYGLMPVAVGLLGLLCLGRRRHRELGLLVLAFLASLSFALTYAISDYMFFFIPTYLVFAIWVAVGLAAIRRFVLRVWKRLTSGRCSLVASAAWSLAVIAMAVWPLRANYAIVDDSDNYAPRVEASTILDQVAEGGVLVVPPCCDFYSRTMALMYLREAEGIRPDVAIAEFDEGHPEVGMRPSYSYRGEETVVLLEEGGQGVRAAFVPHVSPAVRSVMAAHYLLRPLDTSASRLSDFFDGLPAASIVIIASRHPAAFTVDEDLARTSVDAALQGLGFAGVRWPASGALVMVGVRGAEPGTATEAWHPGLAQIQLRAGDPIGTTGATAPVAIQVRASTADTDIVIDGSNVSPHHRDYNLAVLEPVSGRVTHTARFDTETFLIDNIRVYRIAAVKQGDEVLRVDPGCWHLPNEQLDFADPGAEWFLENGWSGSEPWGTWAVGLESSVQVALELGSAYTMYLDAAPYCPAPDARQSVEVLWNGATLGDFQFAGCEHQTLEVNVPASAVTGQVDRVSFRYAYAVSPLEATGGANGDARLLAVGFTGMRFEPRAVDAHENQ